MYYKLSQISLAWVSLLSQEDLQRQRQMKDGLRPVKVIRCIITLEPVVWVIIHTGYFFSKMDGVSSGLRGARFVTLDMLFASGNSTSASPPPNLWMSSPCQLVSRAYL